MRVRNTSGYPCACDFVPRRRGYRNEHAFSSHADSRLDVTKAIADEQSVAQIDPEVSCCSLEQERGGLPAFTPVFRRVRAIVCSVDVRSSFRKKLIETLLGPLVVRFRKVSAANARLISHDDDGDERSVDSGNCLRCSIEQLNLLGPRQVAHIFDDCPVAVEKNGAGKCVHASARRIADVNWES